jgi:hexosaminidase
MIRFLLVCMLAASVQAAPSLMPLPVKMDLNSGALTIDGTFGATATGIRDARLDAAMRRLSDRFSRRTGIPFLGPASATLKIDCAARGADYPKLGEDESYTLDVTPEGATLKAATVDGALRGIETFAQLVAPAEKGFAAPAVHIEDHPRFPWRGLMIDSSRHWMPLPVILRNIDAMAAVKLNVFHWHLSDDQGFRIESKKFPALQGKGSDGHYYTQAEVRQVIAHARDRGIRVVPEFDIPGHTLAWLAGMPSIASTTGPFQIGRTWGGFDPIMDPTKEATYKFLDAFIGEMAKVFPDPYFHIGGDEVNAKTWNTNPRIKAFMEAHKFNAQSLQAYFNQRVSKILTKYHRTMIGWDEVLHPDLPTTTVIQSWRGNAALAQAVAKGHRGILSWGYYLDHLSPASYHYGIDPLGGPAAELPPDQQHRILGGEACMWNEYASSETIDSRIWPRMAAIAERLWSPKDVTDVDSMYTRMAVVSRDLEWLGVQHRANYQPMLDRIAADRPDRPLRTLADAVEATGLGSGRGRGVQPRYTQQTALNRLVDAARPESELVRAMELAAKRMTPVDVASLREQFTQWAANDARFEALIDGDGLLAELAPLSKDLSALGAAGLKILDAIASGQPLPADWVAQQNAEITRMQRPVVEVRMAAARPVKLLLDAATAPKTK